MAQVNIDTRVELQPLEFAIFGQELTDTGLELSPLEVADNEQALSPLVDIGLVSPIADNELVSQIVDIALASPIVDIELVSQIVDIALAPCPFVYNGLVLSPLVDNELASILLDTSQELTQHAIRLYTWVESQSFADCLD